jgi:hypothetical protein
MFVVPSGLRFGGVWPRPFEREIAALHHAIVFPADNLKCKEGATFGAAISAWRL